MLNKDEILKIIKINFPNFDWKVTIQDNYNGIGKRYYKFTSNSLDIFNISIYYSVSKDSPHYEFKIYFKYDGDIYDIFEDDDFEELLKSGKYNLINIYESDLKLLNK